MGVGGWAGGDDEAGGGAEGGGGVMEKCLGVTVLVCFANRL